MALWCIVPAAGKGLRVGGTLPKQYLALKNSTVMQCTLDRLSQLPVQAIIIPVAEDDQTAMQLTYQKPSLLRFVAGGKERADSVLAGLDAISHEAAQDDWVLVHDVARPCVRLSDIEKLIAAVADSPVGGLLANRVRDTMKRGDNALVQETVARDNLWHALTPQLFRYGLLRDALQQAHQTNQTITDEAQAIERLGLSPLLVEAAQDNIKITWPDDLALAEVFLAMQEKS